MALFETLRKPENYGWVMVAVAATILAMGMGTLFSISVYLKPLSAEFGWARGETALAYSSAAFLVGLSGIATGALADRFSTRPIVLIGAVVMGGALVSLGFVESLWQLYAVYGPLLGAFGLATFMTPLITNVGFWFTRNRGMAIGTVIAGQSLGGAIIPPLARVLLSRFGWRASYMILGALAWAVVVPLALLVRDAPGAAEAKAAARRAAGGAARPSISPTVLTAALSGGSILCCICMSIPLVHVVALATDKGIAAGPAASVLSVLMLTSMVGRIGIGKVADYIGGIPCLLLSSGIQTVMIFWFTQMETVPGFYLIAVLFGVGYGGVIPSYAIILRELMPAHRVGSSVGTVMFFANMGMATGGFVGGRFFDLTGGYTLSYATGALTGALNLIVIGTLFFHYTTRRATLSVNPA